MLAARHSGQPPGCSGPPMGGGPITATPTLSPGRGHFPALANPPAMLLSSPACAAWYSTSSTPQLLPWSSMAVTGLGRACSASGCIQKACISAVFSETSDGCSHAAGLQQTNLLGEPMPPLHPQQCCLQPLHWGSAISNCTLRGLSGCLKMLLKCQNFCPRVSARVICLSVTSALTSSHVQWGGS